MLMTTGQVLPLLLPLPVQGWEVTARGHDTELHFWALLAPRRALKPWWIQQGSKLASSMMMLEPMHAFRMLKPLI